MTIVADVTAMSMNNAGVHVGNSGAACEPSAIMNPSVGDQSVARLPFCADTRQ
jgi:hypothetical protein